MNKSWKTTIFPQQFSDNSDKFGICCMVCTHWGHPTIRNWTCIPVWSSLSPTVVFTCGIDWRKKCSIITNRSNLPEARKWIEENLQPLIRKSLPPGHDPPESSLPRRLNKPVITATSQTYADILKKQFSLVTTSNDTTTTNAPARPARKRQATLIDYDSDNSAEYPPLSVNQVDRTPNNTANSSATQPNNDSVLTSIKNELNQLKEAITMAVTQIKEAVATLVAAKCTTTTPLAINDTDQNMDQVHEDATLTQCDIQSFITDLKHELATVFMETRTVLQQQSPVPRNLNPMPNKTWAQLWTSVGLLC